MESVVIPLLDRRRKTRWRDAAEHGIVQAKVRPGHDAHLLDLSADGALIETMHRLLPGTMIELHLHTTVARALVRGRVLRSAVTRVLASGVSYRGAICFESALTHLIERPRDAYAILDGDRALRASEGEGVTRAIPPQTAINRDKS